MMKIQFAIPYVTAWGQNICISGSVLELGNLKVQNAPRMRTSNGEYWYLEIEIGEEVKSLKYKYCLSEENKFNYIEEWGDWRTLQLEAYRGFDKINIQDFWRSDLDTDNDLLTSAFQNVIMHRKQISFKNETNFSTNNRWLGLSINCPRIPEPYTLCVLGNCEELGNWGEGQICEMNFKGFPNWQLNIALEDQTHVEYKYAIYDKYEEKIILWESGENRRINFELSQEDESRVYLRTDEKFKFSYGDWKGLGLCVPVFSLRTERSMGIGEFLDIEPMVDWACNLGIQLVQLLPINDTTVHHDKTDGYPYSSISVFALHPVYINLDVLDPEYEVISKNELQKVKDGLNQVQDLDYEEVIRIKEKYLYKIYAHQKSTFFQLEDYKYFFNKNEYWLKPYAAFCYLRDLFGTANYTHWGEYEVYSMENIENLTNPTSSHYEDVSFHYFVQYHLYKQLKEASDYARANRVILKGDIPIGVSAHSVETWANPELFCMDSQTGAPPDDFSKNGQNWGFPTYNWKAMEKNNYNWWTHRLEFMSEYFDAFRIDHILGFFRVWKIPISSTESIMGHFDPCLPFTKQELRNSWSIDFKEERFCEPCLNDHILSIVFDDTLLPIVKNKFLERKTNNLYQFKTRYNSQLKIQEHFDSDIPVVHGMEPYAKENLKQGLIQLNGDIIFMKESEKSNAYIPRMNFQETYSYLILEEEEKQRLDKLYTHFFYERHNKFWEVEGKKKLSKIKAATNMLIFGEDLGMIPEMVPQLIHKLGILSLNIQRMPKNMGQKFSDPNQANYLSVVSTSTHDMSVVRGWWAELNQEEKRTFYYEILKKEGEVPHSCSASLVEEILAQHLYSPAMWSIFPIQDILALNPEFMRPYPEERINDPSNPSNEWKYRIPKEIEDLQEDEIINDKLRKLVMASNRSSF